MQGISIAPAAPGATVSASSVSGAASANAGNGDEVGSAAGLFGAILAGQMKGKGAAKSGEGIALLDGAVDKAKVGGGKAKDKADIDITPAALSDLLAAAGINVVSLPVVVEQRPLAAKVEGGVGEEGVLPSVAANDAVIRLGQSSLKSKSDVAEDIKRLGAEEDARVAGVEEFAGNGKALPVFERAMSEAEIKNVMAGKSDPFSSKSEEKGGGDLLAATAVPIAMPMIQSAGNSASVSQASAMEIAVPVGSAAWGEALGDKVVWMSGQGNQVAELRLDPPHLGPLEVQLTMVNDQATAVFVSHHPAVREAIESAMPRLREMLADSGIMLGNTMVGAESFQQQQQAFSQSSESGKGLRQAENAVQGVDALGGLGQSEAVATMGKGLVDMFV